MSAGTVSAGTSYAGLAVLAGASSPGGNPWIDDVGNAQGSPRVDPLTKQYVYNDYGRVQGLQNSQALVYYALMTERGSSVLGADFGLEPPGGVIGPNFVSVRQSAIRQALQPLTDKKLINIVSIDVNADVRPVFTKVVWRDNTSNTEQSLSF